MVKGDKARVKSSDVVTREYTIHLHKRLQGITFKKKAPRAISEIRKFATKIMGTKDVRVDTALNKAVWAKGIRNIPYRIRVRLARKRNDDEEAKEKLYTLVQVITVGKNGQEEGFKANQRSNTTEGLQTVNVDE